jgi:hypothetical protein
MATRNTSATIWISMPSSPVRSRQPTAGGGGPPRRSARTDRQGFTLSEVHIDRAYVNSPSLIHGAARGRHGVRAGTMGCAPSSLACSRRPTSASTFAQKPSRALPARWNRSSPARPFTSIRRSAAPVLFARELHASGQRQRTWHLDRQGTRRSRRSSASCRDLVGARHLPPARRRRALFGPSPPERCQCALHRSAEKNLFDLRRASAIQNLEEVHRMDRAAA